MGDLTFDELLPLYRNTRFDAEGDEGFLHIKNQSMLDLLHRLDADDDTAADAGFTPLVEAHALKVGADVRVRASSPKIALGVLARRLDDLLNFPGARVREPHAYYLVSERVDRQTNPTAKCIQQYRAALQVTALFAEAASYLDETKQELVFLDDGKFAVPIRYNAEALSALSSPAATKLTQTFKDDVHREQKLAILAEALKSLSRSQPTATRFSFLLNNIEAITDEVQKGYRLFASSFSYAKIRSELEAAKVEYVAKIHKTVVDIQGQLLGIPVATVVIASQLKVAEACRVEFWTNFALVSGAWIFLALLVIALVNQWLTLSAISSEIAGQRKKLVSDYAAISGQFVDIFAGLSLRICWHRVALVIVGVIALGGALFATTAFRRLSTPTLAMCVSQPVAATATAAAATAGQQAQ